MARILILAGGCRGRRLAGELVGEGHAVRVTTRGESGRAAIEATGAECWIGTPGRLATLRAALESVTIVCWLLGTAIGSEDELGVLHASRLEFFLGQVIDTTVRGFVYEAPGGGGDGDGGGGGGGGGGDGGGGGGGDGAVPANVFVEGERIVRRLAERNEIPARFLRADPGEPEVWLREARAAIGALLLGRYPET
ncbi:MAG: hypothetical protein ACRET5_08995 [Steroidobacteraceae bacterium]